MLTHTDLRALQAKSLKMQGWFRQQTFSPENEKTLRRFSSWEVAELILGLNQSTFRGKMAADPTLPAGMVEPDDAPGDEGLRHRAAVEALEEAGVDVPERDLEVLGGETFASPGTTDEKLFFCAVRVDNLERIPRVEPTGDGSVMEEWGRVHVLGLHDALARCRDGRIPDMKTELALARLAARLAARLTERAEA